MSVLQTIRNACADGKKAFAVLVDPDKSHSETIMKYLKPQILQQIDLFLVGSSLLMDNKLDVLIALLKEQDQVPVVLFPGSVCQVNTAADAILFLSLISGRNPEFLIGNHVVAAPKIKQSGIEVIPTGYILIDGGKPTSVNYMSDTLPIPRDKPDIAACTAMAGEMQGKRVIYMDAGSGASHPISELMIREVRKYIEGPLFIGGGIRTAGCAQLAWESGADVVVVGNALEKEGGENLIAEIHKIKSSFL